MEPTACNQMCIRDSVGLPPSDTDQHGSHINSYFATKSIRVLESLASDLGPFQSKDNQARVPTDLISHKFLHCVCADIEIDLMTSRNPEAVGFGRAAYIAVKSGKHSSFSPSNHVSTLNRS